MQVELEKLININFKDKFLLEVALTHPSTELLYSYERLEFLGDAILKMVIAEMLYNLYPNDKEGDLSKKLTNLVCRDTLVKIAVSLDLGEYIILSNSERSTGGKTKESNLENALESLIGAIYIDSGIEVAKAFIYKNWYGIAEEVTDAPTNPKNSLQELAQRNKCDLPLYEVLERLGPDHSPMFRVKVSLNNDFGIGCGNSKKAAEQNAATDLLSKINEKST